MGGTTTALTPEVAAKGARILEQLNDWLVDTHTAHWLSEESQNQLGAVMVTLRRIAVDGGTYDRSA